jgi:GntR family transcriptional repressor for pyruvate dehydrogenase complex
MKSSAPQHEAQVIQDRIRSGSYSVGEPLPGQRQLAQELGVGRPAVREAVSALEGLGLLQVEPGRGVFVRDPKKLRPGRWRFASRYSVEDVYGVRASLEALSVVLATKRAKAADVRQLDRMTEQFAAAVHSGDLLAMAAADRAFHRQLAQMSGNPLLREMLDTFDEVMTEGRNLAFQDARSKQRHAPIAEHQRIVMAIKSGNAEAAGRKMTNHILQAQKRAGS